MKDEAERVTPELPMVDPAKLWPFPLSSGPIVKKGDSGRHASPDPAPSELTTYQGGKNGAGVYQKIINVIPAHTTYIEPFAGSAAVFRRKSPAASSTLVEIDPQIAAKLKLMHEKTATVVNDDAMEYLDTLISPEACDMSGWFFYIDPPYLHSTRKDAKLYGDWELHNADHTRLVFDLLPGLTRCGARWALSGYQSEMYENAAKRHGWHRMDYQTQTRRGVVTESLWTNYDPAQIVPADLKFAGSNFRERERMKRKAARWTAKLKAMPATERAFIRAALASIVESGEA